MGLIRKLDVATLNALARTNIAQAGGVLVLVGDAKVLEAQLTGLDLPAPRVVSAAEALNGKLLE
jgi:hypothetical protein